MSLEILKNFCSNTNIHGFSYIVQPSRRRIEKIFWFLSILTSFTLIGLLIHKLVLNSLKNPTIIFQDENAISVEDLDFPAVSICYGHYFRKPCDTTEEYDNFKADWHNKTRMIKDLNEHELKMFQVLSLLENDRFMSQNFPNLQIPTDDFVDKIFLLNRSFVVQMAPELAYTWWLLGKWAGEFQLNVEHVLSSTGLCYAFNLPSRDEVNKIDM